MRVLLPVCLAFLNLQVPAFAGTRDVRVPAAKCGRLVCGAPVDVVCEDNGWRSLVVVVPWSRVDLPPSVMAGTLTRITFSSGQYRSSLYGAPRLRSRNGKTEAVFDIGPWASGTFFHLLQTSLDVRISGDYGAYRVERAHGKADPCS